MNIIHHSLGGGSIAPFHRREGGRMTESQKAIKEYLARGGKIIRVHPRSYNPLEGGVPSPIGRAEWYD
jgi:hypothetical protein